MNNKADPEDTQEDSDVVSTSPRRSIPMHIRMLGLAQVRYIFAVIGHLTSMFVLTCIIGLFLLRSVDVPVAKIEQRVREASVSALAFVFPDYIVEVGSLGLDLDPVQKGWVKVNNIALLDIVQDRSIFIEEFRLSPSIRGLLSGDYGFHFVGATRAEIQFQTAESENRTRFGYPINLLDIPANVMRDGGEVSIEDLKMVVTNSVGTEMVAVKRLGASLTKTTNGYDGRINAVHADKEAGAFSFRVQREGDKVSWQGNAREYKVTPDKKLGIDFDLDLVFDDVPPYDLTEQTDNVLYPYRLLSKADGLLRVKFADWVGGGRFEFDPETKLLSLAQMNLETQDYSFIGEVDVTIGDEMLITGKNIALSYPTNLDQTEINDLNFVGKLDLLKRQFLLGNIFVNDGPFELHGRGSVGFEENLQAQFTLESSKISRDHLIDYWPRGLAQKTFDWASLNIEQADFDDLRFDILYQDEIAYNLSMVGKDAILKPTKWLPRFHSDKVRVNLTNDHLLVSTATAQTFDKSKGDVKFNDVQFYIKDLKQRPIRAEFNGRFEGGLSDVLTVLSDEPIKIPSRINIAANRFAGQTRGAITADFPMKKGTKLSEVDLDVRANVSDFRMSKLVNGKNLAANLVNIAVDESSMTINGQVGLDRLAGVASLKQSFSKGSKPDINVKGSATKAQLSSIGLKLPNLITGDGIGYDVKIIPSTKGVTVVGDADIKNLGLSMGSLGAAKPIGRAGVASFNVVANGSNVTVDDLKIRSGNLNASGSIKVSGGKLTGLNFPNVDWPGRYQGALEIDGNAHVFLKNGTINIEGLQSAGSGSSNGQVINLNNVSVRLSKPIQFSGVKGQVKLGKTVTGDLSGLFGGKSPVSVNLSNSRGQTLATINSNDAGLVLRNAGFFGDLKRGHLELKIRTTERAGLYAGKFLIKNSRLRNSRTAVQLLQAASIFGLLDANGMELNEIGGDLLIYPNRMDLYSGRAFGPSIGLTLGGSYSTQSKSANLVGVLTPAYLLNGAFQKIPGLGNLLGGNVGEGVFGVTYQIKGQSPNYQIQANPLSLLTPGKFREIWSMVPQSQTIPQQYRVD